MTSRRPLLIIALILPCLCLFVPAQAQEVDTSATDTSNVAAPAPDTTETPSADTTTAETPPTDTIQAAAEADTTAGTPPADSMTADSVTTAADSVTTAADSIAAALPLPSEEKGAQAAKQAQAAAASWLSLTDAGQFGQSWEAAAATLQEHVSRAEWTKQGDRARSRLDTLLSRTLTRVQYRDSTTQLSTGGPVVALQYRSQFKGGSVLEAVVTTKQNDAWKVAGYRIVPAPKTAPPDSTAPDADTTSQQ